MRTFGVVKMVRTVEFDRRGSRVVTGVAASDHALIEEKRVGMAAADGELVRLLWMVLYGVERDTVATRAYAH